MRSLLSTITNGMHRNKHQNTNTSKGVTLIELLVTLAIFSFVTLVLTTSFITMIGTRGQVLALQQVNDEFRVVLDTLELEVSSGSSFSTGECEDGICTRLMFDLRTREDLPVYFVSYRLGEDGRIMKAVQRSDGVCSAGDFVDNPACWFPVTSEDVDIALLNFTVAFDEEQMFQRPVVTVSLEAEVQAETGETIPFTRSASYSPRAMIATEEIERSDTAPPQILFDYILPESPAGCSVWSDRNGTQFNNNQNWTFNQTIPSVYTNCSSVKIGFTAQDTGSGLWGGRYDGYMAVEGGICSESCEFGRRCACSESPRSEYNMPSGISRSTALPVPFQYDNVLLRPGVDIEGSPQRIFMRARDMAGNFTPDEVHIPIYTLTPFPLTTDGMLGLARAFCRVEYDPRHWLLLAPNPSLEFFQSHVRVHRCEGMTCTPITQGTMTTNDVLDPTRPRRDFFFRSNFWRSIGSDSNQRVRTTSSSSGVEYVYSHDHSSLSRTTYYRYQFTVYNPYSGQVSAPKFIQWEQFFNPALSAGGWATIGNFSDTDSRLLPGAGAVGDGTIGKFPEADWCDQFPDTSSGSSGSTSDSSSGSSGSGTTASLSTDSTGYFQVSVSGGSGTRQTTSVRVRNTGNVSATVSIASISPGLSGAQLATSYTIAPGGHADVRLVVRDDSTPQLYQVVLRLSGDGVTTTTDSIPLVISQTTGGTT